MARDLVLRQGIRTRFVEFSHLLSDLKSGFDRGRGMAELIDPKKFFSLMKLPRNSALKTSTSI